MKYSWPHTTLGQVVIDVPEDIDALGPAARRAYADSQIKARNFTVVAPPRPEEAPPTPPAVVAGPDRGRFLTGGNIGGMIGALGGPAALRAAGRTALGAAGKRLLGPIAGTAAARILPPMISAITTSAAGGAVGEFAEQLIKGEELDPEAAKEEARSQGLTQGVVDVGIAGLRFAAPKLAKGAAPAYKFLEDRMPPVPWTRPIKRLMGRKQPPILPAQVTESPVISALQNWSQKSVLSGQMRRYVLTMDKVYTGVKDDMIRWISGHVRTPSDMGELLIQVNRRELDLRLAHASTLYNSVRDGVREGITKWKRGQGVLRARREPGGSEYTVLSGPPIKPGAPRPRALPPPPAGNIEVFPPPRRLRIEGPFGSGDEVLETIEGSVEPFMVDMSPMKAMAEEAARRSEVRAIPLSQTGEDILNRILEGPDLLNWESAHTLFQDLQVARSLAEGGRGTGKLLGNVKRIRSSLDKQMEKSLLEGGRPDLARLHRQARAVWAETQDKYNNDIIRKVMKRAVTRYRQDPVTGKRLQLRVLDPDKVLPMAFASSHSVRAFREAVTPEAYNDAVATWFAKVLWPKGLATAPDEAGTYFLGKNFAAAVDDLGDDMLDALSEAHPWLKDTIRGLAEAAVAAQQKQGGFLRIAVQFAEAGALLRLGKAAAETPGTLMAGGAVATTVAPWAAGLVFLPAPIIARMLLNPNMSRALVMGARPQSARVKAGIVARLVKGIAQAEKEEKHAREEKEAGAAERVPVPAPLPPQIPPTMPAAPVPAVTPVPR